MKEIKAPHNVDITEDHGITIFLAGSIEMGAAEEWQDAVCRRFSEYDNLTFLNPRRDDWDSSWEQTTDNKIFVEQVDWELSALNSSSFIFMYLDPNTISPISLLELGAFAESGKMMVCCPDGYHRKGNVEIFCERYLIRLDDTLDAALENLEGLIKHETNNRE